MIKLKISRGFVGLFFVVYAVFIANLIYALNLSLSFIVIPLVTVLIFLTSFYWIFQQQSKWRGLLPAQSQQNWKIWDKSLQSYEVSLLPGSYCSAFILILNFLEKTKKTKISILILRDSVLASEFKALKIHLLS